ncbi:putative glycine-rich cell wall structural protein 1 [Trichoplusia ni]|uniref:Glycine-rich cell wall structural protein 1 n=1 Tax=Trichoplusia ni TaxID=7111 RepID=A0A7E5WKD8_TRINI|nr:putative glycine-rich cell wall structural protein 1 [Trichoplusia ni]
MKAFVACIALALVACASAEPPSGYNYNRPSGGGGGGFHGGSGGGLSGGGGYQAVSTGYQTSEGQNVDPQLLEQIRSILLKEEASSGSGFGGGHGGQGGGAPSSSYGVPSSSYGAPSSSYGVPSARVVGIALEGVRQAIQVAQYQQTSGSSGGYPAAVPSGSYGAPSGSYGAPY